MGLLKKVLRERRRGRRDFGPRIFGPRSIPRIPAPVPPIAPFERLPFDDPRNDFMSIQRIEDVGVPGITPIEPVMPPPIPAPIPPVLPKPVLQQPLIGDRGPISDLDLRNRVPLRPPVDPRIIPPRPPSIGGIGGINQDFRPIKMPLPKPDDFMSIGGPGGGIDEFGRQGIKPPSRQGLVISDEARRLAEIYAPDKMNAVGGPGKLDPEATRQSTLEMIQRSLDAGEGEAGVEFLFRKGTVQPFTAATTSMGDPTMTPAPTTPAAVADDVGAVPPTTIAADTRGQIDPVLAQQDTTEVLSDPLLRALYFGTADQPGFINQLQQATQNVMGAELPSTQFDPSMTQQFFNPFEDRVVQQTIQDVMEAGEKRDIQQRARDIQTGGLSAFGSRARLAAADRQEALGRGLAEALGGIRQSGFSEAQRIALGQFGDQYTRQMGQINRPIDLLTAVSRSLPGYGAQSTTIESDYRLPVDPTAAGLGAAFGTYASLKPTETTTT
tara:strand:+ start:1317 stop:2804 length:1488 start_codon:yes stop_codon:yes gene_type:complete